MERPEKLFVKEGKSTVQLRIKRTIRSHPYFGSALLALVLDTRPYWQYTAARLLPA